MAANEACLRKMKEFDKCVYFVNKIKCPMLNDISYAKVLICVIKYKFLTIFFFFFRFYFNFIYFILQLGQCILIIQPSTLYMLNVVAGI